MRSHVAKLLSLRCVCQSRWDSGLDEFEPPYVGCYGLNSFSTFSFTTASILISGGQWRLKPSPGIFFVTAPGAPVSDPARVENRPETRRIGDRRSAMTAESGAVSRACCPNHFRRRRSAAVPAAARSIVQNPSNFVHSFGNPGCCGWDTRAPFLLGITP
jgi:hypothetical protein